MKSTRIIKLVLIAVIVALTVSNGTSQTSAPASSGGATKSFNFFGSSEGIVTSMATIGFNILEEGEAELFVSTPDGTRLETLVEGELQPGEYTLYYKPSYDMSPGEYYLNFRMNGEAIFTRIVRSLTE